MKQQQQQQQQQQPGALINHGAGSSGSIDELRAALDPDVNHWLKPGADWSSSRLFLYRMVSCHKFEAFCGVVILFNMLLVILETDASADDGEPARWLEFTTYALLSFYT